MSAANALSSDPSSPTTPEARAAEPSMEDILASIRRIIADDQSRTLSTPGATRRAAALNVAPSAVVRVERPAPSRTTLPEVAAEPSAVAPPAVRPTYPFTTRAIGAAVAASAAQEPVPHINPPMPPEAAPVETPSPAALADNEDHLSMISEIARAGVAAILNPPAEPLPTAPVEPPMAVVPEPTVLDLEPPVDHEFVAEAAHEPAGEPEAPQAVDEPEVFALNGYEATMDDEPEPEPEPVVDSTIDPLLSAEVGASIESSFQTLATSVFMRNTGAVDVMIRDMLRPLLKTWLDDNLPTIVERLVRVEIERVARGGRT